MSGGVPVSVSFNPGSVESGKSTRLTVQALSQGTGMQNTIVDLQFKENPVVPGEQLMGAVPVSIGIPGGQTTGSWKIRTMPGTSGGTVTVNASSGAGANAATLDITT